MVGSIYNININREKIKIQNKRYEIVMITDMEGGRNLQILKRNKYQNLNYRDETKKVEMFVIVL